MPSHGVTRVYGDGGNMEHSPEDLLVLKHYPSFLDFKNRISRIREQKDRSCYEKLFVNGYSITYAKWYKFIIILIIKK